MNKNIIIKNIYYMLAYVFQELSIMEYDEISSEPFENIHNLFAMILSKGIAKQLKQGLYREYVEKKEDLSTMHGKLNIEGTIKHCIENRKLLFCEYDDFSPNNIYNRIIKTTVLLLIRSGYVKDEIKTVLKQEMLFFSAIDEIDPMQIRWDLLRYDRNNQYYRMLLGICQLVIEGMLLTTESGEKKLAKFFSEKKWHYIYEKFILEFYRKEMPYISAKASEIEWKVTDGNSTLLPSMQTDVTLEYEGKTLIIDAKYYSHTTQGQFDKKSIRSNNIYQIYTYVKNKDIDHTGNVAGLLLYAKTEEEIIPDMDVEIDGNRISAKTLDLNCDFDLISEQLKNIAREYFSINE